MGVFVHKNQCQSKGECRARSDCTYVQSNLALHSPQNECRDRERQSKGLRAETVICQGFLLHKGNVHILKKKSTFQI